jgi:hypothetical protein
VVAFVDLTQDFLAQFWRGIDVDLSFDRDDGRPLLSSRLNFEIDFAPPVLYYKLSSRTGWVV